MLRLFKVVEGNQVRFFENKMEAKGYRDRNYTREYLKEHGPQNHVQYGPDHRLYNSNK